ncbi:putative GTP pyrophosphokinase [Bradyrhizobium sp. GM24.11]
MAFVKPAHPKGRVNRAGTAVRNGDQSTADREVLDNWRASHKYILNTFQATLRTRSRGKGVVVAQRLKRIKTIFEKLSRQPRMELSRMHDVAGCRLIFGELTELAEFRRSFHAARFSHALRNEVDDYNYIKYPKDDGYRGIHDVYKYNVGSAGGKDWNGLQLELQYRTIYQHAWATSVEVVGLVTGHQPKFNAGDERHKEFFRLASEIIARTCEASTSCYPDLSPDDLVDRFEAVEGEINLLRTLKGINGVNKEVLSGKNVILVFKQESQLDIFTYARSKDAIEEYFKLEKSGSGEDIVYVSADSGEDVRSAFRNYFSDTRDFVIYIEEGCRILRQGGGRKRRFRSMRELLE